MATVTVSEKSQVEIPKSVRQSLPIRPGQKLEVMVYERRAQFVLVRGMKSMRGFLRGVDTRIPRDRERI